MFFESIGSQGEQLEPKWHSHFGNYIVNTLLALHKFQAKKQIYIYICEQIDPCSGYPSVVVPYVLIVRAVKPCSSGARYFGLAVGLEP